MRREVVGRHTPQMDMRYFIGRSIAGGTVRIIDLESACEVSLNIEQMTRLTKKVAIFGLTDEGDMSVGAPEQMLHGNYITLTIPGQMCLQGVMAEELDVTFDNFLALLHTSQMRRLYTEKECSC